MSAQVHLCNKDSGSGDGSTRLGYVGLFGGYSCAVYTIEAQLLATIDDCSVATKGCCPRNMDKLDSCRAQASGMATRSTRSTEEHCLAACA